MSGLVVCGDREVILARAFADLAGGLTGEVPAEQWLRRLAGHCVDLFSGMGCAVLLTDAREGPRLSAASPETAATVALLELPHEQGPGGDCVRTGQPVWSGDLSAAAARWPRWAPRAVARGVRSVHATPLRTADTTIGALTLFGPNPGCLPDGDRRVVRALADAATLTVLQQRHTARTVQLNTQLQTALSSRVRIEQAKGIIAHALAVSVEEAFQMLRHHCRTTNTKLTVLVGHLIDGKITAADLIPRPRLAA